MLKITMDTTGLDLKDRAVKRQLPFATMRALNDVAKLAQLRTVDEMRTKFDRPTLDLELHVRPLRAEEFTLH